MLDRNQLIELLERKYPKLKLRTTEEFNRTPDGIWVGGEDGILARDGKLLFSYYNQDYTEKHYTFGVHKEFNQILANAGWYAEWYDAGTLMLWINC